MSKCTLNYTDCPDSIKSMTNTLRNSQLFLKNKWKAPLVESVSLESSVMNVNKLGLNSLKLTKKKSVPRDMLQILHDYLDKSKPKQKSLLDDVKVCIESNDPADITHARLDPGHIGRCY